MKLTLNLASRRYFNERALKSAFLLSTALLSLLLVFQLNSAWQNRKQIISYRADIAALEDQLRGELPKQFTEEQIATQKEQFSRAGELLARDSFRWTTLFDRLENLLPRDVSIRSFTPNYQAGTLTMSGAARDLEDLQDFLDNLHQESFRQVFLQNQNQIEVTDPDGEERPALAFTLLLEGVL